MKIVKSDAEWRAQLTPLQYIVTRRGGTERAPSDGPPAGSRGPCHCVCCGTLLFDSSAALAPAASSLAFRAPVAPDRVVLRDDYSWLRRRTEVACAACDAHLGHLSGEGAGGDARAYLIQTAAVTTRGA